MILGMTTATYTLIHVLISIAGIVAGFVAAFGLIAGRRFDRWTAVFLVMTIATSVTGFGFPIHAVGPPHIIGVISLVILAVAVVARYRFHLAGSWRWIYVVTATIALYLNVFVGVVQAFQKIPALHALAPTQAEPPFVVAQVATLAILATLGTLGTMRFRVAALRAA
jgi:hypothetical protein